MEIADARQAIEDLILDYAHCIDDDRLEAWPGFFTADCFYQIISRDNHARNLPVGIMTCDSRAMLEDRIASLRSANIYEPHVYRHLLSALRHTGEENGIYTAETGYAVIRTMQDGSASVFSSGKYLDRIVFEDGAPRFKSRIVVCDSTRIDTLIVIPL